jgi:hypothetical protein
MSDPFYSYVGGYHDCYYRDDSPIPIEDDICFAYYKDEGTYHYLRHGSRVAIEKIVEEKKDDYLETMNWKLGIVNGTQNWSLDDINKCISHEGHFNKLMYEYKANEDAIVVDCEVIEVDNETEA